MLSTDMANIVNCFLCYQNPYFWERFDFVPVFQQIFFFLIFFVIISPSLTCVFCDLYSLLSVCWYVHTEMGTDHHPLNTDRYTHVVSDHLQPPSLSTDTTVLIIFLLGCVVLGLCIKLCLVLLNNWR